MLMKRPHRLILILYYQKNIFTRVINVNNLTNNLTHCIASHLDMKSAYAKIYKFLIRAFIEHSYKAE